MVTLLVRISDVLSQSTFGIVIGTQSLPEAERTMYELIKAVNSIKTLAIATQAPMR